MPSQRFNPSVGILFVHTVGDAQIITLYGKFQSLGRDSVCSYRIQMADSAISQGVSIPRSGFCLFIPAAVTPSCAISIRFQSLGRDSVCSYYGALQCGPICSRVSIPRSGFCLFIPTAIRCAPITPACFNPSVGILFVHTCRSHPGCRSGWPVSIPRSGFCLFIRCAVGALRIALAGFNPSVGILFVHTWSRSIPNRC